LIKNRFSKGPRDAVKGLELLEQTFHFRADAMEMALLKRTQGINAPLKLMLERQAAGRVGRLPFLPSSQLMKDVLEGKDEDIGVEDFLGSRDQPEAMGPPHMVVERSLNLL